MLWLLVLLVAFFVWMGWVLHKRRPNPPGQDTPRRDLGSFN